MLTQLQQNFSRIDREVVLEAWSYCNENIAEAKILLTLITENALQETLIFAGFFFFLENKTLGQQSHLMNLFNQFGNKVERVTILQTWKNFSQIYCETREKLREICSTYDINELKESNEIKIMREMCLHILWNILKHPKKIKYRQISNQGLYDNLKRKCYRLGTNVDQIFDVMKYNLFQFKFEKRNDENWYCFHNNDIQLLLLWKCYKAFVNEQRMYYVYLFIFYNKIANVTNSDFKIEYKTRYDIPERVIMLKDDKWREYEIAFDYQHRTIMLLSINENEDKEKSKLKIEPLQVGNPNKSSLEFNVHIQWYNDLNNEFNSFCVNSKDGHMRTHKEPLNPYSMTLKQGIQRFKDKLQLLQHFMFGADEFLYFECEFDKCEPSIPANMSDGDVLLHDIYKHLPHYPSIHVCWKIKGDLIVPYKHTIDTERANSPNIVDFDDEFISSNEKPTFNPFLYECDVYRLRTIKDIIYLKMTRSNELKKLLHEVIQNGYLSDLITFQYTENKHKKNQLHEIIKQQINFNEVNPNELILNDKILTILNEVKILYHDDIHKQMGYTLQLYHICAVLLYCGRSCNVQFSYDQIQFRHYKWPYLDKSLQGAVMILHSHERREEDSTELYCGLKNVRLENIKEIKSGCFISHVSTSDDIQVAQTYRTDQGCILHFHPSMRRSDGIWSFDVSWMSPFKHEREILFSRPGISFIKDEKTHKELSGWNAKVESEDEHTQMILLTWTEYDKFIQQAMQISAIWNYSIDLNIIYLLLKSSKGSIDKKVQLLFEFEEWKLKNSNEQKYIKKINEFVERRCCNHSVNLFFMFLHENEINEAFESAQIFTVRKGLPFVEKDKMI
ncbi:hypothetical protein RFI_21907 [Reticulomyxa filosa]|uniref:Uncharacterized protein n=1 Tax=Reticulomyxa filosa TaxID=46433 RepID=X6MNP6_RETFI|nr:hypothetical protein RFI_21907 [Reticulomyxa filosa]|eukprot:ETO15459.1 hypothetical protein RFI_21907 [Reticulomyxa filosa]